MEKFNLRNHWQEFIDGKIAINCKTEELAKEFLGYCQNEKGLLWGYENKPVDITYWDSYNDNTCYEFSRNKIFFADVSYCKDKGYTIVSFEGFEERLEVFDLEKHWDRFINERDIAVNCRTEDLAKEFLEYCENKGLNWGVNETCWDGYEENTCYGMIYGLGYSSISFYKSKSCKIVEFKGFKQQFKPITKNDLPELCKCIKLETGKNAVVIGLKSDLNSINPKANPVVIKENIEVIYNGSKTIVIIRDGKRFYKGVAKCSSEDIYDKEIGFQTAYNRAREKQNLDYNKKYILAIAEPNPKYECKGDHVIELIDNNTNEIIFSTKIDTDKHTQIKLVIHKQSENNKTK